jgi:hypothetical protein
MSAVMNEERGQTGTTSQTDRYARCVEASKRVRWEIERDVIRGRRFNPAHKFLPDGLSQAGRLPFLTAREQVLFSQVQGRTYANMFGLVERFIGAKMLESSQHHWLGDQTALEALVRFSDEELKHQELFRRLDRMIGAQMLPGYQFVPDPNSVARAVLAKSTWAVLALICHIEFFVLAHYRQSIDGDGSLSPLYRDVFLFHAKEESQHAILDELEWRNENARIGATQRDMAVDDLIALVGAVDGILVAQAGADTRYFIDTVDRTFTAGERDEIGAAYLAAYRWQYIVSGVQDPRFQKALAEMTTPAQLQKIVTALQPLLAG